MEQDDFFSDSSVTEVAENHISRILKLEEREAERVVKTYRRIRQDLRDRLESLPPGTFTAQQLGGILAQIDAAIAAMSSSIRFEMDSSAQLAAEAGIEDLIKELETFNSDFSGAVAPINLDAVVVATDTKNLLFNQYDSSMLSYDQGLRSKFAMGLTNAVIEKVPMSEVVSRISKTFLGEEWRIHRIVRTELHNIYSVGKLNGMDSLWADGEGDIPDLKKALYHPMDNRTAADSKYADAKNLIVPIDEPFVYKWKGETRRFMAPPDRPNDRSILIPYRESW